VSEIPEHRETSFERTAKRGADGPGEGLGLAFLFASFSLASKEKEGEQDIAGENQYSFYVKT